MGKQCWSQAVLESGSWGYCVLQTPALVCCVVISPEQKSCAGHNFDTLRHILIMFGRNEEEDQQVCCVQE